MERYERCGECGGPPGIRREQCLNCIRISNEARQREASKYVKNQFITIVILLLMFGLYLKACVPVIE